MAEEDQEIFLSEVKYLIDTDDGKSLVAMTDGRKISISRKQASKLGKAIDKFHDEIEEQIELALEQEDREEKQNRDRAENRTSP